VLVVQAGTGQVVGTFHPDAFHRHGFRWAGSVQTDLGTLAPGADSEANAVNDAGQVAGTATRSPGGFGYPVRWSATGATPSTSRHWFEGTVFINVNDGRITIANGADAVNNKLSYVDIYNVD
jgi:probable HAF family extracellular repeat protein